MKNLIHGHCQNFRILDQSGLVRFPITVCCHFVIFFNVGKFFACYRRGVYRFSDCGSAVIFGADSGLRLSYVQILGPKRNVDHRSFFSLSRNVTEFIQVISFFERSSFTFRCETVIGIVLCYSHQACL